jgi:hypothetical protein
VHRTRLNQGQRDALNDEKIVWQLRFTLIKMKCPVSRRAFLSVAFPSEVDTGSRQEKRVKLT